MIIAEQKRKENIAEYLLYMYQVEDLIRTTDLEQQMRTFGVWKDYESGKRGRAP